MVSYDRSAANIKKLPGLAGVNPGVKTKFVICGAELFFSTCFEFLKTLSIDACDG